MNNEVDLLIANPPADIDHFLKTAKLNCKIFPAFNLSEIIIFVEIVFFEDETIIFEEDLEDINEIEHLNNFSPQVSNALKIPLSLLKSFTKNKLSFTKILESTKTKRSAFNSNTYKNNTNNNHTNLFESKNFFISILTETKTQ